MTGPAHRNTWSLLTISVVVGVLCAPLGVVVLFGFVVAGTEAPPSASTASAFAPGLDPAGIPAGWVPWIERAGSLCPAVTAPALAAQLKAESDFDPNAESPTGASGPAQFEPGTWAQWSQPPAVPGPDVPTNPPDAIMAQGRYMCALAAQAQASGLSASSGVSVLDLAIAGYNAGWGAVVAAGGIPRNGQTGPYVAEIESLIPTFQAPAVQTVAAVSPATDTAGVGSLAAAWPNVYEFLVSQLGDPYVWGGTGPTGWDCSGLVMMAFRQAGIDLPRTSEAQYTATAEIPYSQAQPGDLLFMEGVPPGHVAVYLGDGKMLQAPHTGAVVDIVAVPAAELTGVGVP